MAQQDKDLERIAQTVAGIQRDMADKRAQNRIAFPEMTRVVDYLESKFGKVKVIWAEEGCKTIGKIPAQSS